MERGRRDKGGLSDIIVTIVLIGLALAAIVIVWAVISGLIGQGTKSIDLGGKCLGVSVAAVSANCSDPAACSVTLERTGTGSDEISGVKFVFRNSTANSGVMDISGNIQVLAGKTAVVNSTLGSANSVGVTVYFKDKSGADQICSQTNTFNF